MVHLYIPDKLMLLQKKGEYGRAHLAKKTAKKCMYISVGIILTVSIYMIYICSDMGICNIRYNNDYNIFDYIFDIKIKAI